jgi:hypothetical protein
MAFSPEGSANLALPSQLITQLHRQTITLLFLAISDIMVSHAGGRKAPL